MRLVSARFVSAFILFASTLAMYAQNDRGTITGELKDQAGAVVPNATVVATNRDTGAVSRTTTTDTGNYTIPSLQVGVYTISVEVKGFKRFVQENIEIQVATTNRIDIGLQVGSATETVTITAEAPLLKTETAEQSTIIETDRINRLPLNFGGGGGSSGNIRSTFAFNILSPGVTGTGADTAAVNGLPTGTFRVQIEGQDATSQNDPNWTSTVSHASVDSIEEFSLQTSTFSPEFSQVGGGFYNFTTKSGTNQFHGGAYEYLTNEALNAQRPYFTPTVPQTNPRSRKHDFGGTFGGPVWIPKVYNGRNKTFFFVSEEVFRNVTFPNGSGFLTLPTTAMRNGDFSSPVLFPANNLGTDPNTGVPILNGAIYNPTTRTVYPNGQISTLPFANNKIPASMFDPVAIKIQNLIPAVTNANPTSNFVQLVPTPNNQQAFTIKIDQVLPDNSKLSFYFNKLTTNQLTSNDSLPYPVSGVRVQAIYGTVPRLNYDKSITPTLLVHAGVGYQRFHNPDSSPADVLQFDAAGALGFIGSATSPAGFPRIEGLNPITSFGPSNANSYFDGTFTSVLAGTWVHGNHTYKLGGEWRLNSWTDRNSRGSQGHLQFNPAETGDPYLSTNSFGTGTVGNAYASFLLGLLDGPGGSGITPATTYVNTVQDPQLRKQSWGLYLQDTWKVTRKLTLEYGLRWDRENWGHEIHNRWVEFGPNTPNPTVNNILGGLVYEGSGPGGCNCSFTNTYPYAIGPRLGAAYQLDSKTVLRAGAGVSYAPIATFNYITNNALLGVGYNQIQFASTSFGVPAATLAGGLHYNASQLTDASHNPGLFSNPNGAPSSPNFYIDPNAGRPARILQWSIGLQREVVRNLTVEANYVGNRGAWEYNGGGLLGGLNTPNPANFAKYGIDPTTAAGQLTLSSTIGSAAGIASGVPRPYPTFPLTQTVLQALRPYPQVSGNISVNGAPLGDSWYNSLQVKVNKRYSHGLSISSAFTWSKTEANPAGAFNATSATINNIFNRANQKGITANDIPFIFNTGITYEVQKFAVIGNRYLKNAIAGWTVGGLFLYSAGVPIAVPTSSNNQASWYGQNTLENRVPGQPLFLNNPNCHCTDPTTQFILNPAAWANPALGQWGTSAPYYTDYRYQRRPNESINVGRTFRIRERNTLEIRAEFFNILNRLELNNPTNTSPQGTRSCTNGTIAAGTNSCNAGGTSPSGFGAISYSSLQSQPRNGQLVARFTF
jgi:hypothetical protein